MGLLDGVRIIDFSVWRPGPYATQLLAEIGADVVKVEPPGGDPMRMYPGLFSSLHANKHSVVLDLKGDPGRARATELVADADVVIEGFRPGVAARLGVAYDDVRRVNPSVVYCSVSGFGQHGPLALVAGHDVNYQAWAGALAPEGGAPVVSALPIADLAAGMSAAFGICAALVRKGRTGEGEYIDVAMADVLATWTGAVTPHADNTAAETRGVPGYGLFQTVDGWISLGILSEDHFWRALCSVLDLVDVADLDFAGRMARLEELQAAITDCIAAQPRDDLVRRLLALDVPVAPVLDRAGMLAVEHFRERGVATADPWSDPAVGYPIRFTAHPAKRSSPPPALASDDAGD